MCGMGSGTLYHALRHGVVIVYRLTYFWSWRLDVRQDQKKSSWFIDGGVQGQESGIRFAIVLWGELNDKCRTLLDCPVLTFADVLAKGHRASATFSPQPISADQLATIVYTSGTTGNPKVLAFKTT